MPKFKTIQLFPNNDHTCLNQFPSFIDSGKVAKVLERVFIHQWSPRKLQLIWIVHLANEDAHSPSSLRSADIVFAGWRPFRFTLNPDGGYSPHVHFRDRRS